MFAIESLGNGSALQTNIILCDINTNIKLSLKLSLNSYLIIYKLIDNNFEIRKKFKFIEEKKKYAKSQLKIRHKNFMMNLNKYGLFKFRMCL